MPEEKTAMAEHLEQTSILLTTVLREKGRGRVVVRKKESAARSEVVLRWVRWGGACFSSCVRAGTNEG